MNVFINVADIRSLDLVDRLLLCLVKKVRPQSIDHYFEMQGLIVKFLIKLTISLVRLLLGSVDLLATLQLCLLLFSVILKYS